MKRIRARKTIVALLLAMALAGAAAFAFVGLDTYQYAYIAVTDGNAGWAYWYDYGTGSAQWHGAYYTDFYVYWNPYYYRWYGVFTYNATAGYYYDVWFTYAG